MKKMMMCMLVAGMLVACNEQAPSPDRADAAAKVGVAREPAGHKPLHEPMFDGYRPSFEYALRSDKVGTGKDGKTVRRVILEYFGDDETRLVAALDHDLKRRGYAAKPWREDGGRRDTQYVKKGGSRVGVTITPATDALAMRNPEADGVVKFVWVVAP
ncbi:MAG TPA: hypothetical protein VM576_06035 [Xanthomonadaceae bacterium]|jgi:hypothetical protein|nr:hypothetical protein [Xanthomonadaceae bacterium]